jgi:hypothetical protein
MNQYHISLTVTVACDTFEEAYEQAGKVVFLIENIDNEDVDIQDVHHWDVEGDQDNEYPEEDEEEE